MKKTYKIEIDAPKKYVDRVESFLRDFLAALPEQIADVSAKMTVMKKPAETKASSNTKGKKSGKS